MHKVRQCTTMAQRALLLQNAAAGRSNCTATLAEQQQQVATTMTETDADVVDHLIAVTCGPIFSFRGFPPRS